MNEDKAIMYSRQQPARVLIPVNYNHLGAHYELIPVEFKQEKYPKPTYRKGKRMIIQGNTIIPDFNKAKETPLYPPYYNAGTYGVETKSHNDHERAMHYSLGCCVAYDPTKIYEGECNILTGKSIKTQIIPVY